MQPLTLAFLAINVRSQLVVKSIMM